MVLFMEGGGFYHDRHTAMLSTDHIYETSAAKPNTQASPKAMRKHSMQALYLSAGFGNCELDKACAPIKLNIMDVLLRLWK